MVKGEREKNSSSKIIMFKEYDRVTSLPSVNNFKKIVQDRIRNSIKNSAKSALILFDIDNFKHVNDSFGHEFGDNILKSISDKVQNTFGNKIIMCRYSGNTFILYINNLDDKNDIYTNIRRIFDIFKYPHKDIYLTISMGVTIIPDDGQEYENLLKNVDIAMYEVKRHGKNRYEFFYSEMETKLIEEYALQKELRMSLEKNEMYVEYQPKVYLENSSIKGFEALVRWNNSKFGKISPDKFIPLAEQSKMIVDIGEFVLEEVCKKINYLCLNGYKDFKIAVNLSEVQFQQGILVNTLKRLIDKYNISSEHLELEITESMFMKSFEKNLKVLHEIKTMGITVALDDFGTGYSSLSYLIKLPIDVLKIDRSFIVDLCVNPKEKYMVESIVGLSHQLGIQVVAEGVEYKEQAEYLKGISCDFIQGYYFSRPKPFDQIINIIGKTMNIC